MTRLDAIPGVGPVAARVIIAEIGTDMTRFPTASPGGLGPVRAQCEGISRAQERNRRTGHGDRYLAAVLGEAAVCASKTNTRLGTQRAIRNHVQHLQALGYQVDLRPVA